MQFLFLPRDSKLQGLGALQIGLRTGYCGCLTTFSSWFTQVVMLMVGQSVQPATTTGTEWVQGLWAVYLGMCGPLLALVVGQHTAIAAGAAWEAGSATRPHSTAVAVAAAQVATAVADDAKITSDTPAAASPSPPALVTTVVTSAVTLQIEDSNATADGAAAGGGDGGCLSVSSTCAGTLADLAAAAILLTLTGVSLAYAYLERDDNVSNDRRYWWFAILLGPPGCVLRWYLSRFNAAPAGWRRCGLDWGWLQLGTYTANMLGCLLDFAGEAVLFRLALTLTNTQHVVVQGLMVGTAGCLSTVSTFVMEIQKLAVGKPVNAYKYFLASSIVPIGLGLLIYGIPAWTAPVQS